MADGWWLRYGASVEQAEVAVMTQPHHASSFEQVAQLLIPRLFSPPPVSVAPRARAGADACDSPPKRPPPSQQQQQQQQQQPAHHNHGIDVRDGDLECKTPLAAIDALLVRVTLARAAILATSAATAPLSAAGQHGAEIFFCGRLLHEVQSARLFPDSKSFVDMPLRIPADAAAAAFDLLLKAAPGDSSPVEAAAERRARLAGFVDEHFYAPGSDLLEWEQPDFEPEPAGFLSAVLDPGAREWALKVHALWKVLGRRTAAHVRTNKGQHSLIAVPYPTVVPGDRFRETYYWDSYWIVRGLLVSGMTTTARAITENLLSMVRRYGFVPNGSRVYYLSRSQPPVLSETVRAVHAATGSVALLREALPLLQREHDFFTTGRRAVRVRGPDGRVHTLSRYWAEWQQPRPESYYEDQRVAGGMEPARAAACYRNIASAAESGWDFSSRWFEDPHNIATIRTTAVLPVDLNAFLFQMEENIASFAELLGEAPLAARFRALAAERRAAVQDLMWDEPAAQWRDLWLPTAARPEDLSDGIVDGAWRSDRLYASNFVPVWCGLLRGDEAAHDAVAAAVARSRLLLPGGLATSEFATQEQWDAPNAWPPLQHMVAEGLDAGGGAPSRRLARSLASRWLRTNRRAFDETGVMHEKYDARRVGGVGGGGEYVPQIGFGWSNGVVLSFLDRFGWPDDAGRESHGQGEGVHGAQPACTPVQGLADGVVEDA